MSTTFQYKETSSTSVLTTTSSQLLAYDLQPTSVSRTASGSNVWDVSYSTTDLLAKKDRLNAIYNIYCADAKQYSTTNSNTYLNLRLKYCIQPESYPSVHCPEITDYNGLATNTCSRIYSKNQEFNNNDLNNHVQCSELKDYLDVRNTNTAMKTAVQNSYNSFCSDNPTMRECQCYNRSKFDAYNNLKKVLSSGANTLPNGNESCWYIPCQYQTNITVDPDIQNAYDRIECPDVCQNIIAAINVKNFIVNDVSLSNQCATTTTSSDISKDVDTTTTNTDKLFKDVVLPETTTSLPPTIQKTKPPVEEDQILPILRIVIPVGIVAAVLAMIFFSKEKKNTTNRRATQVG